MAEPANDVESLERLLRARHACVSILTFEEEHAVEVARQAAMARGWPLWIWSASLGLHDGLMKDSVAIADTENPAAALFWLWMNAKTVRGMIVFLDLANHLREDRALRLLRDLVAQSQDAADRALVMIDASDALPPVIQSVVARLELSFPGDDELTQIVRNTCRPMAREGKLKVELTQAQLTALVANLRGLTRRQAMQAIRDVVCGDGCLDAQDIAGVARFKRNVLGSTGLLEFVNAPTSLDDIGGLRALKSWLNDRVDANSDEAREFGITPPRGVLLLGVQGAGKSLAAKAVATAWHRPLMRMEVGAFYNRYIGETERQLRDALRQAEMMAPVVLWIDEIEKAFASAGATSSADGGLSKRMFGSFLTWMQEHRAAVFLIATANDIESLPPELLRKGRFDEIFFVDLPDAAAREQIVRLHLSKRGRDASAMDVSTIVTAAEGYSGAEIEQGIVAGLHAAFAKRQLLTTEHIVRALRGSPPLSVTMAERIEALRRWATGRCVMAG